jgi:ABC-2 type transport system permease protein
MRTIWTICRRELYSYFVSPVAWVLLTIFAILGGFFTYSDSVRFLRYSIESQTTGGGGPMNLNEQLIAGVLWVMAVVGLFLVPLIAMRLFAEEKRQGTIELLMTSPASDVEIILGKWLAAVLMYASLLVILLADLSFLFIYGHPDWKPVATGFLGLLLQGACLLSFGTFISTTTKNQIVAAAIGFAFSLLLYVLNSATEFGSSLTTQVLGYISITSHYESFVRGVIDTKDLIFYLSMIFLGLFLTARSLESIRWRA